MPMIEGENVEWLIVSAIHDLISYLLCSMVVSGGS